MTYEIIKKNFDRKLWDKSMVAVAVAKNKITSEQYKEITGEEYTGANVPASLRQTVVENNEVINTLLGVK